MNFQFTKKSSNSKIGAIPCTVSPRATCPDTCQHKLDNTCYYETGFYTKLNWNKLDSGERGASFDSMVDNIAKLKPSTLWRYNVGGDLMPRINEKRVISYIHLEKIVIANNGKRGFTYTHHDMSIELNRFAVQFANKRGFTINLSADSFDQVDKYKAFNIAPVVTTLPIEYGRKADKRGNYTETMADYRTRLKSLKTTTSAGNSITVCPAVNADNITCENCQLCARSNRKTVVGFPAHGTRKNSVIVELN